MHSQQQRLKMVEEQERRIKDNLARIKHKLVVFSGKGGVGKTTVAVNLAYALARSGKEVGLLDADLTGPNVPQMVGLQEPPAVAEEEMLPQAASLPNLKVISLATMIPADAPVIWRGPMRSKALEQFLGDVAWGELDFLVADLPPGTGDEVMTIAQRMEPELAIIVTTPQEVSLIDARRAINMAKRMGIPKIGVVENMSSFRCPNCGHELELFGSGGGERAARELAVMFLGKIPFNLEARRGADLGRPIVLEDQGADISEAFEQIAREIVRLLDEESS
ncbi:MAG: Mrp/NBP35 family ATP-binding protein [Candidatus Acetothermia bacterium]|jgi:ATP-binding protein involved in chromosome partitioning|nr:Mrp/NBP35 family ATP-binding protein [Candidatus Acetothermia bacterium]MDH7505094.1 Mrp/NBP35 family ATP-binding protein [Candidatus Acetothermia bacterium]